MNGTAPLRFRLAAGAAIAAFGLPALAGVVGVLTVPETSAQEAPEWATETPEQRCARQTAEWDASMEAAWRAAHPGQEPGPGAWPPYICVDVPTPDVPVPPVPPVGGGSVTVGNPPGREHQWDIRGEEPSEYRQDMRLGSARDHRTAPQAGTTATSGPRAGDSARSNVSLPSGWSTTATDREGNPRDVRVVDTEDGVLVVDPEGRATGDVLVTDPDTGESRLEHRDGVSGHEVGAPEDRESNGDRSGGPAGPRADNSAGAAAAGGDETGDIDPAVPVGVAGALAGGFVAVRGRRGFRNGRGGSGRSLPGNLPGLDAAPRVTISHLTGAEQTIFALLSPASDHTQEFDLNIPEGGHAEIRPDGGVDVLDADGTLVRQVAPPWAFDARGIPQPTWFTIDPETGNLVQHVAPLEGALYPIIADPAEEIGYENPSDGSGAPPAAPDGFEYVPNDVCTPDYPYGYWSLQERQKEEPPSDYVGSEEQRQDNNALAAASTGNNNPADIRAQQEADEVRAAEAQALIADGEAGYNRLDGNEENSTNAAPIIGYENTSDGAGAPPDAPEGHEYVPRDICTAEYPNGFWELQEETLDSDAEPGYPQIPGESTLANSGVDGAASALNQSQEVTEYGNHAKPHVPSTAENIISDAGRIAKPVGVAATGYNIATADNPAEQTSKEVGGVIGGTAGAAILGTVGAAGGPVGAALLGGAGAVVGDWAGQHVGGWVHGIFS